MSAVRINRKAARPTIRTTAGRMRCPESRKNWRKAPPFQGKTDNQDSKTGSKRSESAKPKQLQGVLWIIATVRWLFGSEFGANHPYWVSGATVMGSAAQLP